MRFFRKFSLGMTLLLLGAISVVSVQAASTCPAIVQAALNATSNACSATGRNQACYGNLTLQAQLRDGANAVAFDKIGDIADVTRIKSLRLSSLSEADDSWGVALMKIQANLPEALPGQNVTFIMFGNVDIDDANEAPATAESAATPEVTVTPEATETPITLALTSKGNANVRSQPSTQGAVLTALKRGEAVIADGRLADSSWIRIQLPENSGSGWVSASLLQGDDIDTLPVADADSAATSPASATPVAESAVPVFGPMQAFYFKSGLGDTPCTEVPASGVLIQAPAIQKVTLMINGAELTLGSTAYITAQPGGFMTITVIEGSVTVTMNGVTQAIPAGRSTRIPLDANGLVTGSPETAQPYDPTPLAPLPISLLPISIDTAPPLTDDDISAVDALPTSGTWQITDGPISNSNCQYNYPPPYDVQLTTQDNGNTLIIDNYTYDLTRFGVYVLRGLPFDDTKLGHDYIREAESIYIQSRTEARIRRTDFIPSQNCTTSLTAQLLYLGAAGGTGG